MSDERLFAAVEGRDMELLRTLLDEEHLDPNSRSLGRTPLMGAAWAGAADVASLLISRGADVNAAIDRGEAWDIGNTALMIAAGNARREVVEVLCRNGAAVNAQSKIGRTALMFAADSQAMSSWMHKDPAAAAAIVKILLAHGADPNLRDRNGWGALDWCQDRRGRFEEVKSLLFAAGADVLR